jgi:hypothetical protein
MLDHFLATCPSYDASYADRREACKAFWKAVPEKDRVPMLLEVLRRYREHRQKESSAPAAPVHTPEVRFDYDLMNSLGSADLESIRRQFAQQPAITIPDLDYQYLRISFALNELAVAGYSLRLKPTEEQVLAILKTAFHTCGHGSDVAPPVTLALKHFEGRPYTPAFFDAIRTYREALTSARGVSTQVLKGRLELVLWQDLSDSKFHRTCWTSALRAELHALSPEARRPWLDLFQLFRRLDPVEPPKNWRDSVEPALENLTPGEFSRRFQSWIDAPVTNPPQLSTPGGHALKNLVWCAVLVDDPALDEALLRLLDLPWKNKAQVDKVAGAVGYLWSQRPRERALPALEKLYPKWGNSGGKIGLYLQRIRKA